MAAGPDLAQREARALRRGNGYDEIILNRYVVEGTFTAAPTCGRPSAGRPAFIAADERPARRPREIETRRLALNWRCRALAAGNPLLMVELTDADLGPRLERLERSHVRTRGPGCALHDRRPTRTDLAGG
ncbi:hypothetical protein HBB16_09560 [Pseudonocardia sp. MCCB 268]|nr:hypothetical protein [Pseudonocardia cytotoxica]